jgi:uncharacterized protein (DUF2147 family)
MVRSKTVSPTRMILRAAMVAGLAGLSVPAYAADAKGVWLRSEGTSRVKIASCGAALCGTVVWLQKTDGPGKVGQRVFFDMKPAGAGTWEGSAFNPEDGRTYSGKMEVSGNALTTTGCALGGLICKSVNWSRVN